MRREISDEAEQIRMNFKQAKGRREQERERQRINFLTTTISQVADSLANINVSIEPPKLK